MILLNLTPVCFEGSKLNRGDSEQDTNITIYSSSNSFFIQNNDNKEVTKSISTYLLMTFGDYIYNIQKRLKINLFTPTPGGVN
jgi:hypothetical protein